MQQYKEARPKMYFRAAGETEWKELAELETEKRQQSELLLETLFKVKFKSVKWFRTPLAHPFPGDLEHQEVDLQTRPGPYSNRQERRRQAAQARRAAR